MCSLTDLHSHELSANTRNNYRVQWTGFVNWAQSRGFCALPAAPDVVAAYLAERFEKRQHKPATLRLAASAIGHFHRVAKLDNPSESGKVRSTLSGATRKAGLLQKQARGLTESDLDAIRKSACRPRRSRGGHLETEETARRRGEVDIAIVSLMRDCLLRVSEAAAARHCDIEQMEDDTGRLLIRRSKTDQEGKSAKAFISRGRWRPSGASGTERRRRTVYSGCAATRYRAVSSRPQNMPGLEMASAVTPRVWAWRSTLRDTESNFRDSWSPGAGVHR